MRISRAAAAGVTAALLITSYAGAPAARAAAARSRADGASSQLITVVAASYGTTYATLTGYRRSGLAWVRVLGPWSARIGYNGMAPPGEKREGDGRTPAGTYGFRFFFGVRPNPGVAFRYRHAYGYDVWDDDPSSARYNEWIDDRQQNPGAAPEPMHNTPAYDYSAVIAYNTARVPGLGSAIFLHVGTGAATAGCVSLPVAKLLRVLRWLRPARSPRIRMRAK